MESKNLPPSSSAAGLLCNIMIVWRRWRSRAEHSEEARRNASLTLAVSGPSAGAARASARRTWRQAGSDQTSVNVLDTARCATVRRRVANVYVGMTSRESKGARARMVQGASARQGVDASSAGNASSLAAAFFPDAALDSCLRAEEKGK